MKITHFPGYNNFNPRSPCGERPELVEMVAEWSFISIHAPRAGSDPMKITHFPGYSKFQSTLPVRGATAPETDDDQL